MHHFFLIQFLMSFLHIIIVVGDYFLIHVVFFALNPDIRRAPCVSFDGISGFVFVADEGTPAVWRKLPPGQACQYARHH